MTVLFVLAFLPAWAVLALVAPDWLCNTVIAALVAVYGYLGAPADKPLLDTAVVRHDAAPLTSAEVFAALAALNIAGINQAIRRGDNGKRWFPAPVARENGVGWRCEVELPRGVTASTVVEKREELAAALTRPLGCVWPEANAEVHPGRLVLFVADKDMSRAKQKPFPLLCSKPMDTCANSNHPHRSEWAADPPSPSYLVHPDVHRPAAATVHALDSVRRSA